MDGGTCPIEHAQAVHLRREPFSEVARDLGSLVPAGVCANPYCSKDFVPVRAWSKYCCRACGLMDDKEHRAFGHRVAPAMLAWISGRHAAKGTVGGDLSRAGRTYYTRLASEWRKDREARAKAGRG
jgi:hypothetical protein